MIDYKIFIEIAKLYIRYIKDKLWIGLIYATNVISLFAVYALCGYDLRNFTYSLIFSGTILIIISIFGFNRYYDKHIKIRESDDISQLEGRTLIEEDYIEVINNNYEEIRELKSKFDIKYKDMIDYYSMWVHQIKTPIAASSLVIQSMESSIEKTMLKGEIAKIEDYVQMAIEYLKIDSHYDDLKIKKYPLNQIVKNVVKKSSGTFIYKKLGVDIENIDIEVLTDNKQLEFIIGQIVSNALKYTKQGKISFYLEGKTTLVVEDTGVGIPKEDLPRIFEKGYTGYNGHTGKKSTGIGLYLCNELANKLGHKIWIESEIGIGTKVYIDFSTYDLKLN